MPSHLYIFTLNGYVTLCYGHFVTEMSVTEKYVTSYVSVTGFGLSVTVTLRYVTDIWYGNVRNRKNVTAVTGISKTRLRLRLRIIRNRSNFGGCQSCSISRGPFFVSLLFCKSGGRGTRKLRGGGADHQDTGIILISNWASRFLNNGQVPLGIATCSR